VKRVGHGVPASFLAGSDYVTQRAFISVYHRYRKYHELRDLSELKGEEDSLASYFDNFYDSHNCSSESWKLSIRDGDQRSFAFFSSDWKYRNDADLVAVRHNCTFTGFTGTNFSGESVQVSATDGQDRWVVFAKQSPASPLRVLHESILSYQCLCRNQTSIS